MLIVGDASGATGALKKVGKGLTDQVRNAKTFKDRMKIAGAAIGGLALGAIAAGGAIAVDFGKKSIDTFKKVAGEVAGLKRITGMTTEDASRLGFALKQSGVDGATGAKSFTIFGKNLAKAASSGKTAKEMAKVLGTSFTDAQGKVLPMAELLPKVSDKFASMPDGAEKTALAMKLFGKSGTSLLPFLNKGSAGMADLAKKSDALGNTIGDKQLQALKDSKQAQRDWDAAMQGLQVTLGAQLLPIMTQGAQFMNATLIPAFQGMAQWVADNSEMFTALGNMMRWVWNNILLPLVKLAIVGFANMGKTIAQGVQALGALTGNKDLENFGAGLVKVADQTMAWANGLQAIPEQVAPTVSVKDQASDKLKAVNGRIKSLRDRIVTAKAKGDEKGLAKLQRALKKAAKEKHELTATIKGKVDSKSDTIKLHSAGAGRMTLKAYALGGLNTRRQFALVGERGAELVELPAGSRVRPAGQSRAMMRGRSAAAASSTGGAVFGGVVVNVYPPVGADRVAMGREIRAALLDFKRTAFSGRELGIA